MRGKKKRKEKTKLPLLSNRIENRIEQQIV